MEIRLIPVILKVGLHKMTLIQKLSLKRKKKRKYRKQKNQRRKK